jgi:hypothetical protein
MDRFTWWTGRTICMKIPRPGGRAHRARAHRPQEPHNQPWTAQNISARPRKRKRGRTTRQAGLFRPLQNVQDARYFSSISLSARACPVPLSSRASQGFVYPLLLSPSPVSPINHPRPEIFSRATGPCYIYSLAAPAAFPRSSPSPSAAPPYIGCSSTSQPPARTRGGRGRRSNRPE